MSFYSLYCLEGRMELYAVEREALAVHQGGRLISTQKGYQCAYEFAVALAQAKQMPLVDHAQAHSTSMIR
jgi:hypothetical protein